MKKRVPDLRHFNLGVYDPVASGGPSIRPLALVTSFDLLDLLDYIEDDRFHE